MVKNIFSALDDIQKAIGNNDVAYKYITTVLHSSILPKYSFTLSDDEKLLFCISREVLLLQYDLTSNVLTYLSDFEHFDYREQNLTTIEADELFQQSLIEENVLTFDDLIKVKQIFETSRERIDMFRKSRINLCAPAY